MLHFNFKTIHCLRGSTDYIEANLAKQMLADFGVESVLTGQNTANVYSIPAIAATSLQTLESQARKALEILESQKKQDD